MTSIYSNDLYTVGWICALNIEHLAGRIMLDEEHGKPQTQHPCDSNVYRLGTIDGHHIAMVVLPKGLYGTHSANTVTEHMRMSFENLRFGLVVGIGGGIWSPQNDIRLGDVVVGVPSSRNQEYGGVVSYTRGDSSDKYELRVKRQPNIPPLLLLNAVSSLESDYDRSKTLYTRTIRQCLENYYNSEARLPLDEDGKDELAAFHHPGFFSDMLFTADYVHSTSSTGIPNSAGESCQNCDPLRQVSRTPRSNHNPRIHKGLIASGDILVKDSGLRERIRQKFNAICVEMEAAGLLYFPSLVIRGISDYADSHKNKTWQQYAALTAAAYARELLQQIVPFHPSRSPPPPALLLSESPMPFCNPESQAYSEPKSCLQIPPPRRTNSAPLTVLTQNITEQREARNVAVWEDSTFASDSLPSGPLPKDNQTPSLRKAITEPLATGRSDADRYRELALLLESQRLEELVVQDSDSTSSLAALEEYMVRTPLPSRSQSFPSQVVEDLRRDDPQKRPSRVIPNPAPNALPLQIVTYHGARSGSTTPYSTCTECLQTFTAIRFQCINLGCKDVSVCRHCRQTSRLHQHNPTSSQDGGLHTYLPISESSYLLPNEPDVDKVRKCSICGSVELAGVRYRCKTCPEICACHNCAEIIQYLDCPPNKGHKYEAILLASSFRRYYRVPKPASILMERRPHAEVASDGLVFDLIVEVWLAIGFQLSSHALEPRLYISTEDPNNQLTTFFELAGTVSETGSYGGDELYVHQLEGWSESSDLIFKHSQMLKNNSHATGRLPEFSSLSIHRTIDGYVRPMFCLDERIYTPTKLQPFNGIWVGNSQGNPIPTADPNVTDQDRIQDFPGCEQLKGCTVFYLFEHLDSCSLKIYLLNYSAHSSANRASQQIEHVILVDTVPNAISTYMGQALQARASSNLRKQLASATTTANSTESNSQSIAESGNAQVEIRFLSESKVQLGGGYLFRYKLDS